MSIQDTIKNSFLREFSPASVDYRSIIIALTVSLLMGIVISIIYKHFFGGVVYSTGYAETLIGMSVLTCMVTLAISTNVVISLGMVGSLSIIRYRTAVKSPLDLLYMFWAVTVGITSGAQLFVLALIASAVMYFVVLFFHFRPASGTLYVAVIHYTEDTAEQQIFRCFGRIPNHVKSKTMYKDHVELAVEFFCKKNTLAMLSAMREIPGVSDVTFIQYNGEYHG